MRFASLEAYGIHPAKLLALAFGAALGAWLLSSLVVGSSLGGAAVWVTGGFAAIAGYLVLASPRRMFSAERIAQSREAVLLSLSSSACMDVTKSRSRTLMLLRARSRRTSSVLRELRRDILLGFDPRNAVKRRTGNLASSTLLSALEAASTTDPGRPDTGGEETEGYAKASELDNETRLPLFMTVCFFTPILLILFSVFSHSSDPKTLAELVGLEFISIDLAFFFSATDGHKT